MDEILASIRKIIADDPNAPRNGPDRRAINPLLEPAHVAAAPRDAAAPSDGPLLPPAERFGDVLRSATDSMRAAAANQPRAFADRSLDELFDDEPTRPKAVETAAAQNTPSQSTAGVPSQDPWAAWRNLRPPSELEASEPVQVQELSAPVPASPAPASVAAGAGLSGNSSVSAAPSAQQSAAQTAKTSNETAKTPQPAKPGFYPPAGLNTPRRHQSASFASAFPKSTNIPSTADAETKSEPVPASPQPLASQDAGQLNGAAAASGSRNGAAVASGALNGSGMSAAPVDPPLDAAAQATAAAASQALEKLAVGLSEPPTALAFTPAAGTASTPTASVPRTLDDVVSDMLRPMLEKWVETNMPRLMEKALRPSPPKDTGSPKA